MIGSYRGATFALLCLLSAGVGFSGCNSGTRSPVTTPATGGGSGAGTGTGSGSGSGTSGTTFSVVTTVAGTGTGSVTISPAGTTHPVGTVLTLTAVPQSGSTFLDWGGDQSGNQNFSFSVTLSGNLNIAPDFAVVASGSPVGDFTISPNPAHALAPATISFTDSSTNSPTTHLWDFGDGSPLVNSANPTHQYQEPGQYTVTLRVTNANGAGTPKVKAQAIYVADRSEGSRFYYVGDLYGNAVKQNNTTQAGLASEVLTLVNAERAKVGAAPLTFDQQATDAAKAHAEDMRLRNYFSHNSPEGFTPADRLAAVKATGFSMTGENIALGQTTAAAVMTAWMNSPGHRANILNPNFTHLGIGVADPGPYWVQVFLRRP
jgi:uncharacterized protein YkwD